MEYFDILLFQIKQVNNAIPSITVSDLIFHHADQQNSVFSLFKKA